MTVPFEGQAQELRKLLDQSGLSLEELASQAHLKSETLRKYLGGYQRAGERTMVTVRAFVQLHLDRLHQAAERHSPYELLEEAVKYASKLLALPESDQQHVKGLIDSLRARQPPRKPDDKPKPGNP